MVSSKQVSWLVAGKLLSLVLGIFWSMFAAMCLRGLVRETTLFGTLFGLVVLVFFGGSSALLLYVVLSNVKRIRIDFDQRVIVLQYCWVIRSRYGFAEFAGYKPFVSVTREGPHPAFFLQTATGIRATFSAFELANYEEVRQAVAEAVACNEHLERKPWRTGNPKTMGVTVGLLVIIYVAVWILQ